MFPKPPVVWWKRIVWSILGPLLVEHQFPRLCNLLVSRELGAYELTLQMLVKRRKRRSVAVKNWLRRKGKIKGRILGMICPNSSWQVQCPPSFPALFIHRIQEKDLKHKKIRKIFWTCIAPLERLKLECIVQGSKYSWVNILRCIWVTEGLRGFWKGNALNLFRMVPFKSINFICYDLYLANLLSVPGKEGITNRDRLIGGGISGIVATVLCIPLDTIRTRLVAPGGKALGGVAGCFCHMVQKEGFLSLYKGLTPALISMAPASAVFYAAYDMLKSSSLSHKKKMSGGETELGPIRTLIYGAIAGACAETVTYPLEVIRRKLQLQQAANFGLASAFILQIESDGVGSLFSGLFPSTLQVLPSAAFSYFFYETMKSILKIN
ncbi:probable mitochondrial adenine nucleotide transporter BTL3 isoform X3 [Elaeis guineensis]|uniref:probable mitochondrial adenine nucleotide transporter BTL3 isoform X3 n=1 Tax=Elaeis guineensis var. tenera TaxID=51953 RepID=UPI003C6DB302